MAVPTRNVGRTFAEHCLRFHHEIFQDLVEGGAHMDITVGERRAVMQNEELAIFARFLDLLIKAAFVPHLEQLGLARRQIRLHRKIRARQIEGVFVIFRSHRGTAPVRHRTEPT